MVHTIVVAMWLIIISFIDIRRRRVPLWLLVLGGIVTVSVLGYRCAGGTLKCAEVLEGMLPGAVLLAIGFATKKIGYGDGVVLLLMGMMAGLRGGLMILGLSLFLVSICSVVLLVLKKANRNTGIPYLPFLTAVWIALEVM